MFSKKLLLTSIAIVALFGAFLLLFKTSQKSKVVDQAPVKKVTIARIAPVNFSPTSPFCGFSAGAQRTEIAPEINGVVQKLLKNEGEAVSAGEIIAIVDNSNLDAQASGSFQITHDTEKILADTRRLYNQKVDEAEAGLKKSKASYASGNAVREDVKLAEESVASAKRARDLQIAAAKVQLSASRSQQSVAASYAQKQTLRAPFSGIITRRHTTVGSFAPAGTPIYSLSAPGAIEIELSLPKNIIENLTTGQELSLARENSTDALGFIYAKNSFLNFNSPDGIVRLRTKNSTTEPVSIGEYVCAQFPTAKPKESLLVPESAILHEFGDAFVFVAKDHIAHKKNVKIGATSAGQTEILDGLQADDDIITQGLHEINTNDPIIY